MPRSRVFAILSLVALTVFLAACGNEDDNDPTPVPTQAVEATVAPTGTTEAEPTAESTSSVAIATPMESTMGATPVAGETGATPVASTPSAMTPVMSDTTASPAPVVMTPVTAAIEFTGAEQRDYMITDEGCVGIGEWSPLKAGAQVIVRDATGTVVDVSTLEADEGAGGCSWTAELSVPGSEFVSISIPMVTEVWFDQTELESGEVSITIP